MLHIGPDALLASPVWVAPGGREGEERNLPCTQEWDTWWEWGAVPAYAPMHGCHALPNRKNTLALSRGASHLVYSIPHVSLTSLS